jgi:hypothetical protein
MEEDDVDKDDDDDDIEALREEMEEVDDDEEDDDDDIEGLSNEENNLRFADCWTVDWVTPNLNPNLLRTPPNPMGATSTQSSSAVLASFCKSES